MIVGLLLLNQSVYATTCSNQQPHDLPLLTHYREGVGTVLAGTDVPQLQNTQMETQYRQGQTAPVWRTIPGVDDYIGMNYDVSSYPNEQVVSLLNNICQSTGVEYRLLQPGLDVTDSRSLGGVFVPQKAYGQIIHSLRFRNNLFTVVLPPRWDPHKVVYPLIINGFYGLNDGLMNQDLSEMVARTFKENGIGAIGLQWNGGGTYSSRTMSNKPYEDLNEFVSLLVPILRIDAKRVIAYGGSRGAVTALNIASHPAITAFTVRFVRAAVPAADIPLLTNLTGTTFPGLMSVAHFDVGYAGAWKNNFRYPIDLSLTGSQAHMGVLTGTIDEGILQREFNLISLRKVWNLKERGTEVLLEIGSHDSIVPFVDQVRLMRAYHTAGILVETRINYLLGHGSVADVHEIVVRAARQVSLESHGQKKVPLVRAGQVVATILEEDGGQPVPYILKDGALPLTVEMPRYMHNEINAHIIATGTPGRSYRLLFAYHDGLDSVPVDFELDSAGTWIFQIDTSSLPDSRYVLVRIDELDQWGNPFRALRTLRSSVPMNEPIVADVVRGDLFQYGYDPWRLIQEGYYGPLGENRLKRGEEFVSVSNGVVAVVP
jgi:predicted esterase